MHIYKFRVLFDGNEEFFRDIEIKSTQTFEDFHNILINNLNLNKKELASFYLCDNRWNKTREITLVEMGDDENSASVMKNSRLCDFIDDPHQHLAWVYDFLNMQTFYIELTRIGESQKGVVYPRVTGGKDEFIKPAASADPGALAYIDDDFGVEFENILQSDEEEGFGAAEEDDTEEEGNEGSSGGVDDDDFYSTTNI